ncbi:MAG: hypothetical protein R3C10_05280 [Pirellulales bacterium]|nr:hypothetical protein [Planctomycetales bacterium]
MQLPREEYIEQAHFFRVLAERGQQQRATQDVLLALKDEVLATTKLPMAIDFMVSELKLQGVFSSAMARLQHYFTPFQTYLIQEAEQERGRFDFNLALEILRKEAEYRSGTPTEPGVFLYQFEAICRNRLGYDPGLVAISGDPIFDEDWRAWVLSLRSRLGVIDVADLIYVRSAYYWEQQKRRGLSAEPTQPVLFGSSEGKIAMSNRHKDPLFLFSALERQLGYPTVPRPAVENPSAVTLVQVSRKLDRLERRIKMLEDEQRGGIDLSKFYVKGSQDLVGPTDPDESS